MSSDYIWFIIHILKNIFTYICTNFDTFKFYCTYFTKYNYIYMYIFWQFLVHINPSPDHCRLQNHHGYIKHHHRGMGGSPDDVGEVSMTQMKQRKGCRMRRSHPYIASPTSHLILQPLRCFTYVTGTWRTSHGEPPMHRGMKKQSVVD